MHSNSLENNNAPLARVAKEKVKSMVRKGETIQAINTCGMTNNYPYRKPGR